MILDYQLLQNKGYEVPEQNNLSLNQYLDIPVFNLFTIYIVLLKRIFAKTFQLK